MTQSPVKEGDVLAGKYRVERTLGVGGMGVVVAARHIQLEDQVALKFLLPDALENAELVARFQREARAAVKIKGEHVAKVLDVGTMDTGAPYMVMEFLQGGDLEQLLERRGTCPVDEAVDYIMQGCEAMAEAHALGIIHRDLKPANLFLSQRADGTPIVKVLDFGISKALKPGEDASVTKTTAVMGSPLYMSPEQLRASRNVDARSDIWSLGVILYELLMGTPPFLAPTMPQLCAVILSEPPIPLNPDLPEPLQRAILKCLAKEPGERYSNVAEFTADIIRFGSPSSRSNFDRIKRITEAAGMTVPLVDWSSPPGAAPSAPSPGASTSTAWSESKPGVHSASNAELERLTRPAPKRTTTIIGAGIGVAALAAIALVVGLRGSDASELPQAEPPQAAAEQPAPPATTQKIAVSVRSSVPGAKIFFDDGQVQNPFVTQLEPDPSLHRVRVEAPGHQPSTRTVVLDKDISLDVQLEAEPVAAAAGTKNTPATPAAKKGGAKKPDTKPAGKPGSGLVMDEHL